MNYIEFLTKTAEESNAQRVKDEAAAKSGYTFNEGLITALGGAGGAGLAYLLSGLAGIKNKRNRLIWALLGGGAGATGTHFALNIGDEDGKSYRTKLREATANPDELAAAEAEDKSKKQREADSWSTDIKYGGGAGGLYGFISSAIGKGNFDLSGRRGAAEMEAAFRKSRGKNVFKPLDSTGRRVYEMGDFLPGWDGKIGFGSNFGIREQIKAKLAAQRNSATGQYMKVFSVPRMAAVGTDIVGNTLIDAGIGTLASRATRKLALPAMYKATDDLFGGYRK